MSGPRISMPASISRWLQIDEAGQVSLSRDAAAFFATLNQIAYCASQSGGTATRPTSSVPSRYQGMPYFDTDLGFPVFLKTASTNTWVDALGEVPVATRFSVGAFSFNVSTQGSLIVSTLPFGPTGLLMFGAVNATSAMSVGFTDGINQGALSDENAAAPNSYLSASTRVLRFRTSSTDVCTVTISSFDSAGFTLASSSTSGSPTGTANIIYAAVRT